MRRPRLVIFVCIILLGLSLFNLSGVIGIVQRWEFLRRQPLTVSPLYLAVGDAVWALAFAALAIGLWRRWRRARVMTLIVYLLYLAHGWLNRLVFAQADFVAETYGWVAGVDVVSALLLWAILRRPAVREWLNPNLRPES